MTQVTLTASHLSPVLIVTPWYKPIIGGVAEVADRLHSLLERSGLETHLLVCDGTSYRLQADAGHNVWRMKIPSSVMYGSNPKNLAAMLIRGMGIVSELRRFIRMKKIRTAILLFPIDYVWPFLLLKWLTKMTIIASYHGSDLKNYQKYSLQLRYLMRRTLLVADAITVCAKHLATMAQQIVGPKVVKIHLIANCVDSDHFLPSEEWSSRREAAVSLVHVSNFSPAKRTGDIVQAFAMASLPAATRLVMVGYGPEYQATRQLVDDLGIADRVEFAGAQKDVRPFMWQADIFVLASDSEGAPLVLLEAMASGLPWISPPWGAAELLPPGECGLVVPARSPERLAAAMEELVHDADKRKAMGRRGRERAATDFNVESYTQEHCRLIQMVQEGIKTS